MSAVLHSTTSSRSALREGIELTGRIMLVVLFLISGVGKTTAYDATAGYMAAMGVPALLLPAAIALEIAGAVAIIAGWNTRLFAFLLAGFSLVSAIGFHANFADQIQMVMFLRNVSIAGAFLLLVVHGSGQFSLDARSAR